jgi:hypothetical protein
MSNRLTPEEANLKEKAIQWWKLSTPENLKHLRKACTDLSRAENIKRSK